MNEQSALRPVQPGEPAPGFELPAITRDGVIRLADYRGSRPLVIGLFRGLDCPFCRRHIATLGELDSELRGKGVETLAVVNMSAERARAYVRFRPMRLLAAADEKRDIHRAYGLSAIEITEDKTEWPVRATVADIMSLRVNPTGELPEPMDPISAGKYLNEKDGVDASRYAMPDDGKPPSVQTTGTFLVDRDGIVRWTFLEAAGGPGDFGGFPETRQFLAAATSLAA
jgi:peroxiredoxin